MKILVSDHKPINTKKDSFKVKKVILIGKMNGKKNRKILIQFTGKEFQKIIHERDREKQK